MDEYDDTRIDPRDPRDPRGGRRGRRGRPFDGRPPFEGRPPFDGPPAFARAMAGSRGRGGPHLDPWARFPMGPLGPGSRFGGRRRGGRRANRGDVRAAVLALLAEQPMHGYQIIQELEARTDGAWRVSPGSIYPTLQVLEDIGLVRAEKEHGKRVFHLTDEGREAAEAQGDRKPWEEVTDDLDRGLVALRDEVGNVAAAAMQVATTGTDDQVGRATAILADARRHLYLLLAEEPGAGTARDTGHDAGEEASPGADA